MNVYQLRKPALKVITLENSFENWEVSPQVSEWFMKLIGLKRSGYNGFYSNGFLPVDTADFVGTHYIICEDSKEGLKPLAGFRSITLDIFNKYRLPFPGLTVATNSQGATEHAEVVREIMKKAQENGKSLSFGSSWTIHPLARDNRVLAEMIKDLVRGIVVHHQLENKIDEEMCLGVFKAKTHIYFSELGYLPISKNGQELPMIEASSFENRLVGILHRVQFTDYAMESAAKYQQVWNERLVITKPQENDQKIAA